MHGITTNTYDTEGRLTQIASPEGTIHYEYDNLGRLERTYTGGVDTNSRGPATAGEEITDSRYTYDRLGRLKTVTVVERNDAATGESPTTYHYDQVGNLDLTELPNGVLSDYVYDDLNRLDELFHYVEGNATPGYQGGGDTLILGYDYTVRADGKRTQEVESDASGIIRQIDWVFDELGRLTEERHNVTAGGTTDDFIQRYGYDLVSNRVRMERDNGNADPTPGIYNADETTIYAHDANDRLLTETTTGTKNTTITYEYGGPGNPGTKQTKKTVTGDETETHVFIYDEQGRLSQTTVTKGGNQVSVGNLNSGIAATDNRSGTGYLMYSAESVHTRFAASLPFGSNADHFIAVVNQAGQWYYDNNNTLVAFTPLATDLLVAAVDFSADTITSLEGQTGEINGLAQGYASGDLTFTADQFGGQPNDGEFSIGGTNFIRNSSTTASDYQYNDDGVRVEQTVTIDGDTPITTTYHIDPQNHTGYAKAIEELVGGTPVRTYGIGHEVISQTDNTGNVLFFLHDGHGSTRMLLNGLAVLEHYAYDAFGETQAGTGLTLAEASSTTWLFAGDGQFDPTNGLTNHIARWRQGHRFLSLDPFAGNINDPLNLHKYLYVHGDPVQMVDPTGRFSLGSTLGALAVGGLVRGAQLGAVGAVSGAVFGAIDAGLANEDILNGALNGAKWGGIIGFGAGFLSPFATTFLSGAAQSFLLNLGAGASLTFGTIGAGSSFQNGNITQGIFRLGTSFLGAYGLRRAAVSPTKPVNIGGEGEVPGVINLQGRWALGRNFGRSQPTPNGQPAGKSLAGMILEGHDFQIYNASTGKLPYTTGSVPRVYTNSVPIDSPSSGTFPGISSVEIQRVLRAGGQWIRDGVVVFTKPG